MEDDLNTADAISAVFELIKFSNSNLNENSSSEFASVIYDDLKRISEDVLGIKIENKEEVLDSEVEDLIAKRTAARKEKNFKLSDEIRDKLLEMGIELKDTRDGVKWKRV